MALKVHSPMLALCCMVGTCLAQGNRLESPLELQVFQRDAANAADVKVAGAVPAGAGLVEARADLDATLRGTAVAWVAVARDAEIKDGRFSGFIRLATGGWYTLRVRFRKAASDEAVLQEIVINRVGVGDVFVVAGQSNSANYGEERQKPKTGLVVNFTGAKWQLADDPQPTASGGGGSFIPPFGDAIAERFKMPVGIVSCGIGATSVREWLPRGSTFPNPPTIESRVSKLPDGTWASNGDAFAMLVARMKPLGPRGFRAVLWHQGESDAKQADPKRTLSREEYRKYLEQLIRESRKEIGWEPPWFVAQVSYHVPGDEATEDIRAGQKSLWDDGIALQGPDTDALKGDLREAGGRGVHFSGKGLREHGALWAEKVGKWLAETAP